MTNPFHRRLLATIALGSALLVGCGAQPGLSATTGGNAPDERSGEVPAGAPATQAAKAPAGPANPQQTAPAADPVTQNRLLARTASITVQVPDVAAAAARLRVIAAGKGGIVSAENVVVVDGGSGKPSTLVILVPADRLDATLDDIGAVGTVKVRSIATADVTTQVADIDARVRTQRDSIARMQQLLTKAGSIAEIAQVETELTRRQADLESLLARQKALAGQVAESPITVTLTTAANPATPVPTEQPGFMLGLKRGWAAFTSFLGFTLMAVGGFLPFLVFFGAIGTAAWYAARRIAARRRANRPDPTWPAPPHEPGAGPSQSGTAAPADPAAQ